MQKIININFQGMVIPIEESAFEILKKYIAELRNYFSNEPGYEEIINDIECRIAELFSELLKKGNTHITNNHVEQIIKNMGTPADFNASFDNSFTENNYSKEYSQHEPVNDNQSKRFYRDANNKFIAGVCSGLANHLNIDPIIIRIIFIIMPGISWFMYIILWVLIPENKFTIIEKNRKRLYRDEEQKFIAGVCSGLAQYFNLSIWIPRAFFLIPFISFAFNFSNHDYFWGMLNFLHFSFSPGVFFLYIILWIFMPVARTTTEKLEMKGEKINLNNIKNSIQTNIQHVANKAEEFSRELIKNKNVVQQKSKNMKSELKESVQKASSIFERVIVKIIKIIAYTFLSLLLIAIFCSLLGVGIATFVLLPLKSFIIENGVQTMFLYGAIFFFIWLPIIAFIVFVIRKITKSSGKRNIIRGTFIVGWILGWIFLMVTLSNIFMQFSYKNRPVEEPITLINAQVNKLDVKFEAMDKYNVRNYLNFNQLLSVDDDTAYFRNVEIRITRANSDSFEVTKIYFANGKNRATANYNAQKIKYSIYQKDSQLILDKGICITKEDKFRHQKVIIIIAVPTGKRIRIARAHKNENAYQDYYHGEYNNNDAYKYNETFFPYHTNTEYIMTAEGLQQINSGKKKYRHFDDENDDNDYDYENNTQLDAPSEPIAPPNPPSAPNPPTDNTKKSINNMQETKQDKMEHVKKNIDNIEYMVNRLLQ